MKTTYCHQNGAALIVALIVLLVLTILAVTVMRSSTIEERMAGNYIDRARVFQAAESALNAAEMSIRSWTSAPIVGEGVVYALDAPATNSNPWWLTSGPEWWNNDNHTRQYKSVLTGINKSKPEEYNPRFVFEEYSFKCDSLITPNERDCIVVYRVTARATGGRNTSVLLQSLYSKQY